MAAAKRAGAVLTGPQYARETINAAQSILNAADAAPDNLELREDGGAELREDGGYELRE